MDVRKSIRNALRRKITKEKQVELSRGVYRVKKIDILEVDEIIPKAGKNIHSHLFVENGELDFSGYSSLHGHLETENGNSKGHDFIFNGNGAKVRFDQNTEAFEVLDLGKIDFTER